MAAPSSITTTGMVLLPTSRPKLASPTRADGLRAQGGLITTRTAGSTWSLQTTLSGHRKPTSGAGNTNPAIVPIVIPETTEDRRPSCTTTITTEPSPT